MSDQIGNFAGVLVMFPLCRPFPFPLLCVPCP